MGLLAGIGAFSSLMGGLAANSAASTQRAGLRWQQRMDKPKLETLEELRAMFKNYDQEREIAAAEGQGKAVAEKSLASVLREINASDPTGMSTRTRVSAQKATNDILGPLAAMVADLRANATQRKFNLAATILSGNPGNLGEAYSRAADQMYARSGAMLNAGMNALTMAFAPKQPGTGNGGTGTGQTQLSYTQDQFNDLDGTGNGVYYSDPETKRVYASNDMAF